MCVCTPLRYYRRRVEATITYLKLQRILKCSSWGLAVDLITPHFSSYDDEKRMEIVGNTNLRLVKFDTQIKSSLTMLPGIIDDKIWST